jgi:hypothetical protein
MTRRLKLMTSLSTLAAASALTVAGCGGEGEGEGGETEGDKAGSSISAEGEGLSAESEGEGESEGENAAGSGDPATDDVEYMRLLGLVRGHLIAFLELYQSGAAASAMMHVKHPESELYGTLTPAISARGQYGFAEELTALASAADTGGDVNDAFSDVIEALNAHAPAANVATQLMAVSAIVRTAADEFDIGVDDDGLISNAHEYQDAYGFLVSSREIVSGITTTDVNEVEAIDVAQEQIGLALDAFDSLTAGETEGQPSTLYGAAARIEIAARGLM